MQQIFAFFGILFFELGLPQVFQLFLDLRIFKFAGGEFFLKLSDLFPFLLGTSGLGVTFLFQLQYPLFLLLDQLFNRILSLHLVILQFIELLFQLLLIVKVKLLLVPQDCELLVVDSQEILFLELNKWIST